MVQQIAPRPRGPYVHRDTRYVSEFITWAFPRDRYLLNVRLGPAPLELRLRFPELDVERWARVWAKTADAIVVTPSDLVLVEGELRRPIAAIGELVVYRQLIPETASLTPYAGLPVRTILLTPLPDPTLEPVLKRLQIETVPYAPLWAIEYLHSVRRV